MNNEIATQVSKRYYELDWLKVICILGMVMIHCVEMWTIGNSYLFGGEEKFSLDFPVLAIIGCVAPAFMMCLGCGIVLSRRSTPEYLFKRGVIILLIGLALNLFRYWIPLFISIGTMGSSIPSAMLLMTLLIENDIFIFAGLAFMFFALVKKFSWNNWVLLFIGLILMVVNMAVPNTLFSDNVALSTLFGWIFQQGSAPPCLFSFAGYILFPIVGYIVGQYLIKAENRGSFYKTMFLASFLGLVALSASMISLGANPISLLFSDFYYHPGFITVAWFICEAGVLVPLLYCIAKAVEKKKITAIISDISRKLLNIYVVQWLLINWILVFILIPSIYPLIGTNSLPVPVSALSSILIFILSYLIASVYLKLKKKVKGT